jgi:hypothetical protein
MRILQLADGYSSNTAPTIGALTFPASAVTFNPAGTKLTSTNVQAAIVEFYNLMFSEPVDFFDVGVGGGLFNAEDDPIPASSDDPLTVVGTLAATVSKIEWQDDIGEFIGIYNNAVPASPVLITVIGPGGKGAEVDIAAGTVIGIRNMKDEQIATGFIAAVFLG